MALDPERIKKLKPTILRRLEELQGSTSLAWLQDSTIAALNPLRNTQMGFPI
jgi:hypothetical protein